MDAATDSASAKDGAIPLTNRIVFATEATFDGYLGLGPVADHGVSDICSGVTSPRLTGHGPFALVIIRDGDFDPLARLADTTWVNTNGDVVFVGRPSASVASGNDILTEMGRRLDQDEPVCTGAMTVTNTVFTCNDWPDDPTGGTADTAGIGGVGFATLRTTDKLHGWWAAATRECAAKSDGGANSGAHVYCFEVDKP